MSVLRACCWMLLLGSVVGCHSDTTHGYLRSGPVLTINGQPQLSIERVQTASFRPELPPSELARVRLERWPRSRVNSDQTVDVWTGSTDANRVLSPQEAQFAEEPLTWGSQPSPVREAIEADESASQKPITYRRPHLRIDALQGLKSQFAAHLQSGRQTLHESACGAKDWCREFGAACQTRHCELRSQVTEVWDEATPQYWIDAACQTCGERSRQLSSTLRECTDDVCGPGWLQPAGEQFSTAGDRFSGCFEPATESLGRVQSQFDEATVSAAELQPLSDDRPVVPLAKPDIRVFLQPIFRTKELPGEPAEPTGSEISVTAGTVTGVIELPAPADLKTKSSDDPSARGSAQDDLSDTAAADLPAAAALPTDVITKTVQPAAVEVETSGRRAVRKTDRWKAGLRGR